MADPKTANGIYGTGGYFAGYCWSPGSPAFNRVNFAGGAANGTTFTITDGTNTDTYEFRDSTPPSGGDANNIQVYIGPDGFRGNFKNALNGVVDAANITYPAGGQKVNMFATISGNEVTFMTADAPGGNPCGWDTDGTPISCSTNVALATLDSATMVSGSLPGLARTTIIVFQLTGTMISLGDVNIPIPFTNAKAVLTNMNRPQNEAWSVTTAGTYSYVTLTLAGGASPNNQANDYIVVHATEMIT